MGKNTKSTGNTGNTKDTGTNITKIDTKVSVKAEPVHTIINDYTMKTTLGKSTMDKVFQLDSASLQKYLQKHLKTKGRKSIQTEDFLYSHGDFPVLLVAHLDTVHTAAPIICKSGDNNIWMSPNGIGGDDRCGVWIILNILEKYNCHVLFTQDEEIGGLGAKAFTHSGILPNVNYMIEIDRQSDNDAVFYDCNNVDFIDFILDNTGYVESIGSYTDICSLSPYLDLAAVNLSSGYYSPHSNSEFVVLSDMEQTMNVTLDILDATDKEKVYKYEEMKAVSYSYSYKKTSSTLPDNKGGKGGRYKNHAYGGYDDDYYGYHGSGYYSGQGDYSYLDNDAKNYLTQKERENTWESVAGKPDVTEAEGTQETFLSVDAETYDKLEKEEDRREFEETIYRASEKFVIEVTGYAPDSYMAQDIADWMEQLLIDYAYIPEKD